MNEEKVSGFGLVIEKSVSGFGGFRVLGVRSNSSTQSVCPRITWRRVRFSTRERDFGFQVFDVGLQVSGFGLVIEMKKSIWGFGYQVSSSFVQMSYRREEGKDFRFRVSGFGAADPPSPCACGSPGSGIAVSGSVLGDFGGLGTCFELGVWDLGFGV